ncbi:MAG: hypothetical protein Tsb006_4700 [Rickettsiaceae bacterium]
MTDSKQNTNKCAINSEAAKGCMIKMVKSPANWLLIILTYMIWSLVGMRYSTNQNFNMVTAQQNYVMLLSLVSIIVALINHNTKLIKLAVIGSATLVLSFVTLAVSQVGLILFGYPVGYYYLCPITLLLFLLQIKDIMCFAYYRYQEVLKV